MKLFTIKLTVILIALAWGLEQSPRAYADDVLCDQGNYRYAWNPDGYRYDGSCNGYNGLPGHYCSYDGDPYSEGLKCGACYKCVNGDYIASNECNMRNPGCERNANYPLCWAYNSWEGRASIWMDELNRSDNNLCCTPTTHTSSEWGTCSCLSGSAGTQTRTWSNGCSSWPESRVCACASPTPSPTPPSKPTTISCGAANSTYSVTISWTTPGIQYVDISEYSNFSTYYNKSVVGTSSTIAPSGFSSSPSLRSGTTYYVRLYDGTRHSRVGSFLRPLCN